MPALLHMALHYLLGAWAAWCCRHSPALQARLASWPLALVTALVAVLVVPCSTYQFRFYPDHALAYALDPGLYPKLAALAGPLSAVAQVAYVAALVAGYAFMRQGLRRGHGLGLGLPVGAVAIAAAVHMAALGTRPWYLGTYADYWAGTAAFCSQCESFWLTCLSYTVCATAMSHVHRIYGDARL